MAKKDTVFIDIQTSDGGSMQRVAVSAKKLGIALDEAGVASTKAGKSAKNADRNLKGLSKQSSNSTKNFSKMAQGMTGTLVPAYAVLASNIFAITAAFQFLKKAGDMRVMQESQIAFTGATGVGMQSLTKNIQEASGAMLDFQSASEAASIGVASGLSTGQIEALAAGAGNLSKILGRDVTDSFNRLIRGVTKAEPELLDELGITLRLNDANENYAASLRKSAGDLTTFEKKQAVFVEVQTQLEKKYNAVAKATNVQANSIAKLGVAFDRVMKKVKEYIAVIAEPVAEFFTKNILSLTAALGLMAVPIIKAIIPGLNEWGQKSREAADEAKMAYQEAQDELDELSQKQKDIASGKTTTAGIKDPSAGLKKAGGDISKLDKRQAAALLRHAHDKNKKLAHMDKKQLSTYRIHLKAKVRGSYTATEQIVLYWRSMGQRMDVQNKKMVSRWKAAMAMMQGAAAKFTKGMDKLMKGLGIVGVALMLKDIGKELLTYMGFFSEVKGIQDLMEDFRLHLDTIKGVNKEYADFTKIQKELRKLEAADSKVQEDTLGTLQAEGGFFTSMGAAILETNNALRDQEDLVKALIKPAKALTSSEEERLKILKANVTQSRMNNSQINPQMIAAEFKDPWGPGSAEDSKAAVQALKGLETATATQAEAEIKRLEKLKKERADADAAYTKSMDTIKETVGELNEAQIKAVDTTIEYLQSLSGSHMSQGQKDYLRLLKIIKEGNTLTKEQAKEFEDLNTKFGVTGSKAKHAAQEFTALTTQYNSSISSIKDYKTSYTDLIASITQAQETIKQLADEEGKWSKQLISRRDEYNKQLKLLRALNKIEVDFQNDRLRAEKRYIKARRGLTPLVKAELDRNKAIEDNQIKINELVAKQNALKADGVTYDPLKETALQLELDILREQNKELERQGDLRAQLVDAATQALESGLQTNIAALLKGEESSIKDAMLNIMKGIVDSMIDALAKGVTEKIMTTVLGKFGYKTQEQKTKEAVTEGAKAGVEAGAPALETACTDAAEVIKTKAEEGITTAGDGFIRALDDAAKRFAQAIRDACAACSCDGKMGDPSPSTATQVTDMIVQAATVAVTGGAGGTGGMPRTVDEEGGRSTADVVKDQITDSAEKKKDQADTPSPLTNGDTGGEEGGEEGGKGLISNFLNNTKSIFTNFGGKLKNLFSGEGTFLSKLGSLFGTGEGGLLNGLGGLFDGLLSDFGGLFQGLPDLLGGLFGGGAGGGIGGFISGLFGMFFANGGIAQGGFRKYARGGIATGPHIGVVGEGKMNEAIVPLPDGKSIPIDMPKGGMGGMQNNNVGVTVNIDNQGNASTNTESDGQDAAMLGERIALVVQEELLNQKRAGGILSPYGVA